MNVKVERIFQEIGSWIVTSLACVSNAALSSNFRNSEADVPIGWISLGVVLMLWLISYYFTALVP